MTTQPGQPPDGSRARPDDADVADHPPATVERTRHVAAPPERVWRVLDDPDLRRRFLGGDLDVALRPGAAGEFRPDDGGRTAPVRILEVDVPRRLAFEWGDDDDASHVRIALEPDGRGTHVHVREVRATAATRRLGATGTAGQAWCLAA